MAFFNASDFIGIQINYKQKIIYKIHKLSFNEIKTINMEVAESAADLLIYKELDYSCIHGGTNFSSISSGQRPNTR
jgi:hypothetical protein